MSYFDDGDHSDYFETHDEDDREQFELRQLDLDGEDWDESELADPGEDGDPAEDAYLDSYWESQGEVFGYDY